MIVVGINNNEYRLFESWNEITIKKAKDIYGVALTMPEELFLIYKEQSKADTDTDQIRLFTEQLDSKIEVLTEFYQDAIVVCSDIPKEIIKQTEFADMVALYNKLVFPFIFGTLFYPIEAIEDIKEFTLMGETYYCPLEQEVQGMTRPFYEEMAAVFCDASDIDNNSKKNNVKYDMAEMIIAIVYRKNGQRYAEKEAFKIAEYMKDVVTCDIYNSAILQLSKTNGALKQLFPNLYQKGDSKSNSASQSSGLADFGWLNSILTVAEMGILNQTGLTPLDSVRNTDLYDFMTVLSNMRASSDFKRILQEQNNKKK